MICEVCKQELAEGELYVTAHRVTSAPVISSLRPAVHVPACPSTERRR